MYIFFIVFFARWAASEEILDTTKEIHCYCNLPSCVLTAYMCKSQDLGCFSDLLPYMDMDKASHGCLELLPRERNSQCQNVPGGIGGGAHGSLLLCCKEDMCNHVDSPETRTKYNETIHAVAGAPIGVESSDEAQMLRDSASMGRVPGYNSHEVWFKAATIAVPICGALILIMLILLAVKILKSDPQGLPPKLRGKGNGGNPGLLTGVVVAHNPSVDTNIGSVSKKIPLLYQQNDCTRPDGMKGSHEKNEANAKLNLTADLIDLHKSSNRAPCNLYQPLLPPPPLAGVHHKHLYNKALVCGWPAHT